MIVKDLWSGHPGTGQVVYWVGSLHARQLVSAGSATLWKLNRRVDGEGGGGRWVGPHDRVVGRTLWVEVWWGLASGVVGVAERVRMVGEALSVGVSTRTATCTGAVGNDVVGGRGGSSGLNGASWCGSSCGGSWGHGIRSDGHGDGAGAGPGPGVGDGVEGPAPGAPPRVVRCWGAAFTLPFEVVDVMVRMRPPNCEVCRVEV